MLKGHLVLTLVIVELPFKKLVHDEEKSLITLGYEEGDNVEQMFESLKKMLDENDIQYSIEESGKHLVIGMSAETREIKIAY